MSLNLTGKDFQITPAIKQHAEEKFASLDKRYIYTNLHVVLHIEHLDHVAEANLHYHHHDIHATARSTDMYVAIDEVVEKLATQLHKQKEKIIESHR